MNYTKPEITVLGDAVRVIEVLQKGQIAQDGVQSDGPAYDLDE